MKKENIKYLNELDSSRYWKKKYNQLVKEFEQYKKESIKWSIEDFEDIAIIGEECEDGIIKTIYDRSKFQYALELMIREHDCNYGIVWETIEDYLDEYCKLK